MRSLARVIVIVLAVLAACAHRASPSSSSSIDNRAGGAGAAADPEAIPDDVQSLLDRWESCQHWAGEEPYDEERAQEIQAGVDDSCPGNDETRAALEQKYADRPAILARLRALDE